MGWFATQQGDGPPLVLLHGIGDHHKTWDPVLPQLSRERHVIAFDLPGFGRTPALTDGPPTPAGFAARLPEQLAEFGVDVPVAIAGNSLGGWTALEAAKLGHAASVVALDPAGLWGPDGSWWGTMAVRLLNSVARTVPRPIAGALLSSAAGRTATLAIVYGRPWRVPAASARESLQVMADAAGFRSTIEVVDYFHGGRDISVPVTVAFGSRDWVLLADARHRDELPASHRWLTLPGCGHVPMWDDPALVAQVILDGT